MAPSEVLMMPAPTQPVYHKQHDEDPLDYGGTVGVLARDELRDLIVYSFSFLVGSVQNTELRAMSCSKEERRREAMLPFFRRLYLYLSYPCAGVVYQILGRVLDYLDADLEAGDDGVPIYPQSTTVLDRSVEHLWTALWKPSVLELCAKQAAKMTEREKRRPAAKATPSLRDLEDKRLANFCEAIYEARLAIAALLDYYQSETEDDEESEGAEEEEEEEEEDGTGDDGTKKTA